MTKTEQTPTLPIPVRTESRICFGISYFVTEEEADIYAQHIREEGHTYNGGWFHGTPCGRAINFDRPAKGDEPALYAVTTR